MNPKTGLLEWPAAPSPTKAQLRRAWWFIRLIGAFAVISIVTSTISLVLLPRPYDQLRLAGTLFALVLAAVLVGLSAWVIAHEGKRSRT